MSAQRSIPQPSPHTIYCVRCGHHSPAELSTCEKCGNRFRWEAPKVSDDSSSAAPNRANIASAPEPDATEQAAKIVYLATAEMVRRGMTDQEIRNRLMKMGLSQQSAAFVVDKLDQVRTRAGRRWAKRYAIGQALIGAAFFGVGVLLMFGPLKDTVSAGGIPYIFAWGTLVFGALRFVSALSLLLSDDSV